MARIGAAVEGPPLAMRESELVEQARRGDVAAFEELVRQNQDVAFRVAYLITGSVTDAEEAAQDGFLRAFRALDRFRSGAPFRPWLLTIVGNAARSRRTVATRSPTLALSTAVELPASDAAQSPEAIALAAEARDELLTALATLRDDDRSVIACRYFLNLSEAEMADILGCARGTVKSRLSRALGRLRAQLAGNPLSDRSAHSRAGEGRGG